MLCQQSLSLISKSNQQFLELGGKEYAGGESWRTDLELGLGKVGGFVMGRGSCLVDPAQPAALAAPLEARELGHGAPAADAVADDVAVELVVLLGRPEALAQLVLHAGGGGGGARVGVASHSDPARVPPPPDTGGRGNRDG